MNFLSGREKNRIDISIGAIFLKAVSSGLQKKIIDDPNLSEGQWKALLTLAREQALLPIVYEAVYSLLPQSLSQEYQLISVKCVTEQVQKTDSFLRLYRELQKEGIEPLVIKGIVCRDAYILSDWRPSSDEDIYIPKSDYLHFHEAMKCMGFQSSSLNFESGHETTYKGHGLTIEGHWRLFPHETNQWDEINTLTQTFLQHARYLDIEGTKILTPEPTDHMIYLLLHAMKHFSLAGVGIRQICDVAMWARKYNIDWPRVKSTMDAFGGTFFASAILDAAHQYFHMQMPQGWPKVDSASLILDSLEGGIFGHNSEDRLHSASITSASIQNKSFFKNILKSIFPNRKVMENNYTWVSKSPLLLPIGWFVRLFSYVGKITKGASPIHSIQVGRRRIKLLQEYGVFKTNKTEKSHN